MENSEDVLSPLPIKGTSSILAPDIHTIGLPDSRTKTTVFEYLQKLESEGVEVNPGIFKKGKDGVQALRDMQVPSSLSLSSSSSQFIVSAPGSLSPHTSLRLNSDG